MATTWKSHGPVVPVVPNRRSFELTNAAHSTFTLGEANLRQSQLPDNITRADGYVLQRPENWR